MQDHNEQSVSIAWCLLTKKIVVHYYVVNESIVEILLAFGRVSSQNRVYVILLRSQVQRVLVLCICVCMCIAVYMRVHAYVHVCVCARACVSVGGFTRVSCRSVGVNGLESISRQKLRTVNSPLACGRIHVCV